jgi:hypothetical protein
MKLKILLGKLFIGKKRKALLNEFADLLVELPKVKTVQDCMDGNKKVAEFHMKLSFNKKDRYLKNACGQLLQYLLDTKTHIHNGYHRPSYTGWETVRTYPNINDYVNIGVRLNQF